MLLSLLFLPIALCAVIKLSSSDEHSSGPASISGSDKDEREEESSTEVAEETYREYIIKGARLLSVIFNPVNQEERIIIEKIKTLKKFSNFGPKGLKQSVVAIPNAEKKAVLRYATLLALTMPRSLERAMKRIEQVLKAYKPAPHYEELLEPLVKSTGFFRDSFNEKLKNISTVDLSGRIYLLIQLALEQEEHEFRDFIPIMERFNRRKEVHVGRKKKEEKVAKRESGDKSKKLMRRVSTKKIATFSRKLTRTKEKQSEPTIPTVASPPEITEPPPSAPEITELPPGRERSRSFFNRSRSKSQKITPIKRGKIDTESKRATIYVEDDEDEE